MGFAKLKNEEKLFSLGLLFVDPSLGFLDNYITSLESKSAGNNEICKSILNSFSLEKIGNNSSALSLIEELISKVQESADFSALDLMLLKIERLRLKCQYSRPSEFANAIEETKSFYFKNEPELSDFKTTLQLFEAELHFQRAKYEDALRLSIEYYRKLEPDFLQLVYLQSYSLSKIAKLNQKLGRYSDALENFQKSANIVLDKKGCDHYLYAIKLSELADIYDEIGDLKEFVLH